MRALLDTNIVFDILCKRPFDEDGLMQLKIMKALSDVELWVSAKSYTDLFYLMRRELSNETAQDLLEDMLTWLHTCSVEQDDISCALKARWNDFEDSLINVCAEKIKADFLITRDANGFASARIPHGNASEFMDYVFRQTNVKYALDEMRDGA